MYARFNLVPSDSIHGMFNAAARLSNTAPHTVRNLPFFLFSFIHSSRFIRPVCTVPLYCMSAPPRPSRVCLVPESTGVSFPSRRENQIRCTAMGGLHSLFFTSCEVEQVSSAPDFEKLIFLNSIEADCLTARSRNATKAFPMLA